MKNFIGMIALLIMVALLTACGSKDGEKVYVLNWGDYIDPDVIDLLRKKQVLKWCMMISNKMRKCIPRFKQGQLIMM